jgi:hypothetical protein
MAAMACVETVVQAGDATIDTPAANASPHGQPARMEAAMKAAAMKAANCTVETAAAKAAAARGGGRARYGNSGCEH